MRVYLQTSDKLGRPLCGSDFGAVLPRSLRTDRGRVRWAQRLLAGGGGWRLARVGRAWLEVQAPDRPYGEPVRVLQVPLPGGAA